ncbi:MAG: hypothetical protein ACYSW8_29425 [Planctomycetota bacterium]|jgi:hypothetical protein
MSERLWIKMNIPGSMVPSVRSQLDVLRECSALNLDPATVKSGDLVKVDYSVLIKYFGNTVKGLNAVNEICANHPEVVKGVEYEELERGRVLIHEVLTRLDQLMKTVGRPR